MEISHEEDEELNVGAAKKRDASDVDGRDRWHNRLTYWKICNI